MAAVTKSFLGASLRAAVPTQGKVCCDALQQLLPAEVVLRCMIYM